MKVFFLKVLYLVVSVILILIIGMLLPPSRTARESLLFAQIDKDSLLSKTPGPRIIFVGGSNLSFGLDCQMIKDSLNLNPINTAIEAGLGLKYMLRNTLKYIRENDIVVISPEYSQFCDEFNGQLGLLHIIFEVSPDTRSLIDFKQYLALVRYIPEYSMTKLNPFKYAYHKDTTLRGIIYQRNSYDKYGDAYKHWTLPKPATADLVVAHGNMNKESINLLIEFRKRLEQKKAKLFLTFPGYQDLAFKKSIHQIRAIVKALKHNKFDLLGTPEEYKVSDSLIFDTSYHLTRQGVTLRTNLLIADFKKAMSGK